MKKIIIRRMKRQRINIPAPEVNMFRFLVSIFF